MAVDVSHLWTIGVKLNSSIGLKTGIEGMSVLLHLNGGKLSKGGPATAVNSKEGNDAILATLASNAPYLRIKINCKLDNMCK